MNTKIELTYQSVPYTLEYTRETVAILEANGFKIEDFLEKPMLNIELAFQTAFIKNHPKVQINTVKEIFAHCPDKQGLVLTLKKMIDETYESLLADPEEDESGNVVWKTVYLSPSVKNQK